MEIQEVQVIVDRDGKVRIEVRGTQGTTCLDLTKDLEEALGGEIISREMTPEAYGSVPEQVQDRLRQKEGT